MNAALEAYNRLKAAEAYAQTEDGIAAREALRAEQDRQAERSRITRRLPKVA